MRNAHRPIVVTAFVLAAALLCPSPARGQDAIGSLRGHVRDASARGLASVEVTAQSASLLGTLTTKTSDSGEFRFVALPPGAYVIAFSRTGLVPVKLTLRLSLAEAAVVGIVMHPKDGDDGAITVAEERQVFPPSWATSLLSRHAFLEQLPVTGTMRSIVGLTTDLASARPDQGLFLIDGMPLRHGWKLTPLGSFAGPGPETLQELTVTPGRLAPQYGRLTSGALEAVTGRGANNFSGSFRANFDGADLNGDLLREARATDGPAGSAEYTLGGALVRDRIWFFASGRNLRQSVADSTVGSGESFETSTREAIGLAKVTFAPRIAHRFEGQWIGARQRMANALPAESTVVADLGALDTRTLADRALSAGYVGRLNQRLDVSVRYTNERGSTEWTDPNGSLRTSLSDQQTGAVWGAPSTCFGCDARTLTHRTLRVTADTGIATPLGTHDVTFGYDLARSSIAPESDPNGDRFQLRATRSTILNGVVYPVFEPDSSWIVWMPDIDRRMDLRSDAFFVNDRWMPNGRVSLDLGLRLDRNRSTLAADDRVVLSERALSPRLFVNWRISDARPWTVTAGFGRYVADAADRQLENALGTGTRVFSYQGSPINAAAPITSPGDAIDGVFNWFGSAGGTARRPAFALEPALATGTVAPPRVDEWSFGVSRTLGPDGDARIDLIRRTYSNFPGAEIDLGSPAIDRFGHAIDSTMAAPSSLLERTYTGIALKAKYRFGHWADLDGQYTLSKLSGNAAGAGIAGGLAGPDLAYAGYFDPAWRLPIGSLPDDARHRLRMWAHTELLANDSIGLVVLTLVHTRESGRPYGAAALVSVEPFVTNPGYLNPPPAVLYYFTARDALRTEALSRTDIGLNYRRRLPGTVHGDLFAAFHILNVSNNTVVFHPEQLIVTKTAYTDSSLQRFNPFTESPVQGVHWTMADLNAGRGTTLPRTFRFTMGIRF